MKIDPSQPNISLIYVPAAKAMSLWYKWITISLENVSDVVSAAYVKMLSFLTIRDVIYWHVKISLFWPLSLNFEYIVVGLDLQSHVLATAVAENACKLSLYSGEDYNIKTTTTEKGLCREYHK